MTSTIALVVAAGSGQRMAGDVPKQYRQLGGKPVIRHCIDTFLAYPDIANVQVVINPDVEHLYRGAVAGLDTRLLPAVHGGASRQESVLNGLERLVERAPDFVLIHDAARPLVDHDTIGRAIAALAQHAAVVVAVPVVDTIKHSRNGLVDATLDRKDLWRAQTPQGFHFQSILKAHRRSVRAEFTDDAAVAEAAGMDVALVMGSERNLKITTIDDLALAEAHLSERLEYRTGHGFDVHRLVEGPGMMLCGVTVPGEWSLEGHSDADVALHALTDAVLGAIGAGDIGVHFPPSDPKWKGAASWKFLDHAAMKVKELGGRIVHCDLTIICERPKVGPHRNRMVSRIADILRVTSDRVSVKATTTERLGFTGRGEGIAAQATATIALPVR